MLVVSSDEFPGREDRHQGQWQCTTGHDPSQCADVIAMQAVDDIRSQPAPTEEYGHWRHEEPPNQTSMSECRSCAESPKCRDRKNQNSEPRASQQTTLKNSDFTVAISDGKQRTPHLKQGKERRHE